MSIQSVSLREKDILSEFGQRLPGGMDGRTDLLTAAEEFAQQGQLDEAEEIGSLLVLRDDANADAWNLLGFVSHARGNLALAQEFFEKAYSCNRHSVDSALNLAEVYKEMGKINEARLVCESLALDTPQDPELRKILDDLDCGASQTSDQPSMMEKAIRWIRNNSVPDQGIIVASRQRVCYPEVTGYFIPTLLSVGEHELARTYARWLVSVQRTDGSFGAPGDADSYAFDTGQVVRGWVEILSHMPEIEQPLRKACDWLINTADAQIGRLITPTPGKAWSLGRRGEVNEGIHLYAVSPLKRAGEILGEKRYTKFASKSLDYYLKNANLTDFTQSNALSHFYAYIQEALVELGCEAEARKGMASAARYQQSTGAVPGYSDVNWICSTGLAQLAQVWYMLRENDRADAAMGFLGQLQNPSGGFFGSYGVGADYFPTEEISWAAKYAVEASQRQIAAHFNSTVGLYEQNIGESDGRAQAILRSLGDLNGKKVLDAGCGKGRYSALIKSRFPDAEVAAMDISQEMLGHVPSGIRTVESGILSTPFTDGEFDAVICIEALEHVVQIETGIKELSRVLAPEGRLVIIDKNKEMLGSLDMPDWVKWFDVPALTEVMQSAGLVTSAELITSGQNNYPSGLFACWTGTKTTRSQKVSESPAARISVPSQFDLSSSMVKTFDPKKLFGSGLGLTLRCLFADTYLHGGNSEIYRMYDRFVRHFNEQHEHNYDRFTNLIDGMRQNGYDWMKPVYGNLPEYTIKNGIHRCAAAVSLGIDNIPYNLHFDSDIAPDSVWEQVFTRDELAMLRDQQEHYISQCDSHTALMCRVRRVMRDNPKSFEAPFISKSKVAITRCYQNYERLQIPGRRPTIKRFETYGLENFLDKTKSVLEIGCNCGFLSLEMAERSRVVKSFDADAAYVAIGNLAKEYLGIENCELGCSTMEAFQTNEKFDAVVACAVHGWVSLKFDQFVSRILSLVKSKGTVLIESHELDCHPEWADQKSYLLQHFDLLRSGLIDDPDETMYQSEMREYLVLRKK